MTKYPRYASQDNWAKNNAARLHEYRREYYQKNKTRISARRKQRYAENPNKERQKNKEWTQRNPEKFKALNERRRLRLSYGLTPEQVQQMSVAQDHRCLICGVHKALCVDHCHETGKIRGLLCSKCNQGLGMFKDSVEFLKAAIAYLEKNAEA